MKLILLFFAFSICLPLAAQKKVIDPSVYNDWKKNENQIVSNDGAFVSYEINPHRGDGWLYLYNVKSGVLDSFPRGKEAKFSFESNYLAYKITPGFDTLRKCELNKVDKKKWPKDTLGIYIFSKDTLIKTPLLKSFVVGEENNWLSYILDENVLKGENDSDKKKCKSPKKKEKKQDLDNSASRSDDLELNADCKKKKKSEEKEAYKSDGKVLTVLDPISGKTYKFKDVTEYVVSESGKQLAFLEHKKEKQDSVQIKLVELGSGNTLPILPKYVSIKSMTFNKAENMLAFHSSNDTTKVKIYALNLYAIEAKNNSVVADTNSFFIPKGESVSENRKPLFTDDARFMYFGVSKRPDPEKKDTLLESEKVELDIWHYQDKRLQPQQLMELKRDQKRSDLYLIDLSYMKVMKLADDTLSVSPVEKQIGNYLYASSNELYQHETQWDVSDRKDHYRISLTDGRVELIKKNVPYDGHLSPSGKYFSYFDAAKTNYFVIDLASKAEKCITCNTAKVNWQTDVNGMPMTAEPFGVRGYTNNEKELLIRSEYDIWSYSLESGAMNCLSGMEGEQRKIRMEPKMWSMDSTYFDFSNVYVEGFDEKTKGTHLYELVDHGDHTDLKELYYTDHKISLMKRSKNKELIVFRKMSLKDYPEVRIAKVDLTSEKIISNTNPQQDEFNWATVELVKWKSYEGIELEGLVYKPENYDPAKQYPLMVYYYEMHSDDLHTHYVPKPTASIIYPTEYASAGYIVFIPDVRYKEGHPAKSAYDCIMSGTDHVLKVVPNVDPKRMGLQGQSWGGYQTAQLITMTDRYAAAMAGAPVSNMFSAYGGIRWGSGMNRQFQYEKTQSRIGKTIWEAPELYIENSPLFHLPKVKTPLMIMANDKDGAVPWYQGIELFTGMKRLGKPCWMLNYNGDDHNLMENANRMDLSIRMRQFFDHYLLGTPAPLWMTEGIPAIDKGKVTGY